MNDAITKEFINTLPIISYSGEIVVVNTTEDAENCIEEISKEDFFGFDAETKPVLFPGEKIKCPLFKLQEKIKYGYSIYFNLRLA